jgi:N-acetylmuramoyl-L-alanine amidase CwlA
LLICTSKLVYIYRLPDKIETKSEIEKIKFLLEPDKVIQKTTDTIGVSPKKPIPRQVTKRVSKKKEKSEIAEKRINTRPSSKATEKSSNKVIYSNSTL